MSEDKKTSQQGNGGKREKAKSTASKAKVAGNVITGLASVALGIISLLGKDNK